MKVYFYCIKLFFLFFILLSCSKKQQIESLYTIELTKELDNTTMSDFIEITDSITLETNEQCLIGRISKIHKHKDKIYIMDNYFVNAIFVFDLQGNFTHKIGRVGNGPGEYISLNDFTIDMQNEQLLLLVNGGRHIIYMDFEGHYKKIKQLDTPLFNYLFPLGNEYVLGNHVTAQNKYLLYHVDKDFNEIQKYLEIPPEYYQMARTSVTGYTGYHSDYLFVPVLSPVIYQINQEGCIPKYEFNIEKRFKLTTEKIVAFKEVKPSLEYGNSMVEETLDYFELTGFFDLDDYLFTTFKYDKNTYWGIYHTGTGRFNYINTKNLENDIHIAPSNLHFLSHTSENTFAGFVIDPDREEQGLNPVIVFCKLSNQK
jgi:hypothetical protein